MAVIAGVCSGCGEGEYVAEKKYFHANRKLAILEKSAKEGKELDKALINELVFAYKEIILRYPFWDNAIPAQFNVALLYRMKNDLEQARKEYERICKDNSRDKENCANALRHIANIWEQENNWEEAEKVYKKIHEEYRFTIVGTLVPIYLAQKYYIRGEIEKSKIATEYAYNFYKEFISSQPENIASITAIDFLIECARSLGATDDMAVFIQALADKHPNTVIELRCLYKLGRFYQDVEKQSQAALKYYTEVLQKYPDSKIAQDLSKEIKTFSKE